MTEMIVHEPSFEWHQRWRLARATILTALGWILTLPTLARLMHWSHKTVTSVQNVLGLIISLVWGRIGWEGVRRYDFSTEDAFLAGGLAGALAPTAEMILRHFGWPPGPEAEPETGADRPELIEFPFAWIWGFLFGGLVAAVGAILARKGRD